MFELVGAHGSVGGSIQNLEAREPYGMAATSRETRIDMLGMKTLTNGNEDSIALSIAADKR